MEVVSGKEAQLKVSEGGGTRGNLQDKPVGLRFCRGRLRRRGIRGYLTGGSRRRWRRVRGGRRSSRSPRLSMARLGDTVYRGGHDRRDSRVEMGTSGETAAEP